MVSLRLEVRSSPGEKDASIGCFLLISIALLLHDQHYLPVPSHSCKFNSKNFNILQNLGMQLLNEVCFESTYTANVLYRSLLRSMVYLETHFSFVRLQIYFLMLLKDAETWDQEAFEQNKLKKERVEHVYCFLLLKSLKFLQ